MWYDGIVEQELEVIFVRKNIRKAEYVYAAGKAAQAISLPCLFLPCIYETAEHHNL